MPAANSWSSIGRHVGSILTPARAILIAGLLGPTVLGSWLYVRDLASKDFVSAQLNEREHGFAEPLAPDPVTKLLPHVPTQKELAEALYELRQENAQLRRDNETLRAELIEEVAARVHYIAADYERDPDLRADVAERARSEFLEAVRHTGRCEHDQPCTPIADAARHALEPRPQGFRRRR